MYQFILKRFVFPVVLNDKWYLAIGLSWQGKRLKIFQPLCQYKLVPFFPSYIILVLIVFVLYILLQINKYIIKAYCFLWRHVFPNLICSSLRSIAKLTIFPYFIYIHKIMFGIEIYNNLRSFQFGRNFVWSIVISF